MLSIVECNIVMMFYWAGRVLPAMALLYVWCPPTSLTQARNLWYFGSKSFLICYRDSHVIANIDGIVNLMHFCVKFVMRSSTQPKTTAA